MLEIKIPKAKDSGEDVVIRISADELKKALELNESDRADYLEDLTRDIARVLWTKPGAYIAQGLFAKIFMLCVLNFHDFDGRFQAAMMKVVMDSQLVAGKTLH